MTKANMIETIRNKEGKLWIELHEYDFMYAPDDGDVSSQIEWECSDLGHCTRLHAWAAMHDLLEQLGIEIDYNDTAHAVAGDLAHGLFIRRQAAQGIYYDERGNEISA